MPLRDLIGGTARELRAVTHFSRYALSRKTQQC